MDKKMKMSKIYSGVAGFLRRAAVLSAVVAVSLSCGSRGAAQTADVKLELPEVVVTDSTRLVEYEAYTLMYNLKRLNPQWVAWELTGEETKGTVSRNGDSSGTGKSSAYKFKVDTTLPFLQADNDDYRNSGWDRGHMAPAADMKMTPRTMQESFMYVNACPQNHNLNAGVWKSLEERCRSLANVYGKIWIACGPIYNRCEFGTIGPHHVAVPDAFYRVMLIRTGGHYHGIGFICDNKAGKQPLEYYVWTIDEVEEMTGLNFFFALSPEEEAEAESAVDLDLWF